MILITGGTGFVGRHLREELTRRGIDHVVFSRSDFDLTVREQADEVFRRNRLAETVIHLASYQAAGDFPAQHPAEQFHINNLIHTNTLEAWRKWAPQARFMAIGTSCAYPSSAAVLAEDKFLDGDVHGSVYAYALTKRLLFLGLKAYNDQYRLNGSYIIPATMFGEYDDFHVETAHVCGALIGKFVRAVREGLGEVEVWGDGTQVREFMDVKDFVLALLHLVPRCDRDIVNVGPGRGTSIRDLVEAIVRAADFRGKVVYNSDRYVGIKEKFMEAGKLAAKYHWQVSGNLAEGLRRTVEWYARNYDRLKDRRKFAPASP